MIKSKKISNDGIKAKGFYRLQVTEGGEVVGDSGWHLNQVTNDGFREYLVYSLGSIAGSKYVKYAALGTGTVPAAAATSLDGELTENANLRMAVTPTSVAGSKGVQFAFTLNSGVFTATAGYTIKNVGLFDASVTSAGTVFAGNTYTTSALASNQAVNGSYQINFS